MDGFHRWTVSGKFAEVAAMTGGLVPVVFLDRPLSHQMLSTIRHNRARGSHGVLPMARIVQSLMDTHGMSEDELIARRGMEGEEVERLYDRAGLPEKSKKAKGSFNAAWVPTREE